MLWVMGEKDGVEWRVEVGGGVERVGEAQGVVWRVGDIGQRYLQ